MADPLKILGVDPGDKGGLALVTEKRQILLHERMPLTTWGGKKVVDTVQIHAWLLEYKPDLVVCEKAAAAPMPAKDKRGRPLPPCPTCRNQRTANSPTAMFTYGQGNGLLLGALQMAQVPTALVVPVTWKKHVLLGETERDKAAAVRLCNKVYPGCELMPGRHKTPHDGLADALCIAEYGRRRADSILRA